MTYKVIRIPTKITSKDFYKLLLLLFWGKDFVCAYIRAVLLRIPVISQFADYIIPAVTLLCALLAFPYLAKRISARDLVFVLAAAAAYCLNLLLVPRNSGYLLEIAWNFWVCVFPVYLLGLRLDPEEDVPMLCWMSLINIWLHFVYVAVFGEGMSQEQSLYSGSMGRAYKMLPQLLMVACVAFRRPNLLNAATLAAGSVYLFTCGTRGAVACLFLFAAGYLVTNTLSRKKLPLYLAAGLAMVLVLLFYEEILLGMRLAARALGMSERIFNAIESDAFFLSDSRIRLSQQALEAIGKSPVWGYGIAGDRMIVDVYVHNIVLELLVSFGVVAGTLLIVYLVQLICRAYFSTDTPWARELILLLVCAGFVKLFLSSSYLLEPLFFLLMGLCTNQIRASGREKRNP